MEIDARVEAWASLQLLPSVSARVLAGLLKGLGGPEEVRGASRATLAKLVPAELASAIERGPDPVLLEQALSGLPSLDTLWSRGMTPTIRARCWR
jgi:hypothetical protein